MGERSQFIAGDKAPNDGKYIEIGENGVYKNVNDPVIITLRQGESFPDTSNHNRKWKLMLH